MDYEIVKYIAYLSDKKKKNNLLNFCKNSQNLKKSLI
jgi:hypothetical protein